MLFLTNRRPIEGSCVQHGRRLSFDLAATEPGSAVVYGRRRGLGAYEACAPEVFFDRLARSPALQVLLYLHGSGARPEEDGFRPAAVLNRLLAPAGVLVVPVLWPGGEARSVAAFCGLAFAQALDRFGVWRSSEAGGRAGRTSVLAHGAGVRVLRETLWLQGELSPSPARPFFGVFLAAPDVADDTLEPGRRGTALARAARHVVVYASRDDDVLRAKAPPRLGLKGPACLDLAPPNVTLADCSAVGRGADPVHGHAYHLLGTDGGPGPMVRHLLATLCAGRVVDRRPWRRRIVLPEEGTPLSFEPKGLRVS